MTANWNCHQTRTVGRVQEMMLILFVSVSDDFILFVSFLFFIISVRTDGCFGPDASQNAERATIIFMMTMCLVTQNTSVFISMSAPATLADTGPGIDAN